MSEPKLCCNCIHCARWQTKDGIKCHCDLDDRYLGYLQVMDEENDCKNWEKETKWDLQREHDKQIREVTIEKCKQILLDAMARDGKTKCHEYMVAVNEMEQLKENTNE